jgi:hypothetical protein
VNHVIISHMTNHRDKSLVIIDAVDFATGLSDIVRRKKMDSMSIYKTITTKLGFDDDSGWTWTDVVRSKAMHHVSMDKTHHGDGRRRRRLELMDVKSSDNFPVHETTHISPSFR